MKDDLKVYIFLNGRRPQKNGRLPPSKMKDDHKEEEKMEDNFKKMKDDLK
jgi:hypothetical protein